MTDHGTCEDCGKTSRWPRARGRCRTCYPKHVAALRAASDFTSAWGTPAWQRVLDRVVAAHGGCVLWTGPTKRGYGTIDVDGKPRAIHRVVYEGLVGPIGEGLQIDHVCHTTDTNCPGGKDCQHRRCVNPAHLEPVTHEENNRRSRSFSAINAAKTHCLRGHPLDGDDVTVRRGQRECLACKRITAAKAREHERGGPPTHGRRTHCKRGHAFTPENTYVAPRGDRFCRECRAAVAKGRSRNASPAA